MNSKAGPPRPDRRHQPKARGWLMTSMLLCACIFVVFLSFISLEAALLAGIAVTIAAFFDITRSQTQNLEHILQSNVYELSQRQKTLEERIERNSRDIRKMEQDLAKTKITTKAHEGLHSKALLQAEQAKGFSLEDILPSFLRSSHKPKDEPSDEMMEEMDLQTRTPPIVETPPPIANDELLLDDESLSDMVVRELVHHAIEMNRIEVFVQPIVRLPQRQIKGYEMFARIRAKAGVYLPAKRYINLATEENVMPTIDNMLLLHGLQTLRKNKELNRETVSYFLNIKPETIKNKNFMRDLLSFVSKNREMAPSLVFEMRQEDFNSLSKGERQILQGLGQLGCSLSLDNIQSIPDDIKTLQDHKIRYVKISADRLLSAAHTDREFNDMTRMKRKLEANGIGVIVEKIESDTALLELLDFNINYGQGFLFGRPDLQGVYARQRRVS